MRNVNYYEILEIPENASYDEIKAAFRIKVKEYHPDKVEHLGEELRYHANRRFILINEARDILLNPDTRREYNKHLEKVQSDYTELKCPACSHINHIPKNLARKEITCRECGETFPNINYHREHSVKELSTLTAASVLTLRNMFYTKFPELSLVIDIGGLQIDIRKHEKASRPEELYATINNKPLHDYLLKKLNYSGDAWDDEFGVGWISLPTGADYATAESLIKSFIFFTNNTVPVQIRLEPFSIYSPGWSYWASIFILTSLFPIAPWQASSYLLSNNGSLTNILDDRKTEENWMEHLKNNWKIFLMVSKLDTNAESERCKEKLTELEREFNAMEKQMMNIKNKFKN